MRGEEEVDLTDESDNVIGMTTISECLRLGLLHRAVAVLVVRSNGKIVLQQRSKGDTWQPGLWTLFCTGHVKRGESYEEGAKRELLEELGLSAPVKRYGRFLLPAIRAGGLTEKEWVTLYTSLTDDPCTIDPVELESVEEVTWRRAKKLIQGGPLTPDAKILLSEYAKSLPV